ncbi:sigma-70 family RNA polymerase sigma factor [Cellulosimicrobium sp. NPDC057862]|uniref:sigma-70 family RNA polymerase sigma factor n=1 Tax=Cellulosimicrobium sp. NPDC057862 TaxID=3346266 RepID=UPI003672AB8D
MPLTVSSDQVLLDLTRQGEMSAFSELWRRHWPAARVMASRFGQLADPDDIAQEAFTLLLAALTDGRGPHGAFRPYLYRTVRNVAVSISRRRTAAAMGGTEDLTMLPGAPVVASHAERVLDRSITATAFKNLTPRWQEVLWYTAVEDLPAREVATLMGISANAVAALAMRAREGLRIAWLDAHLEHRTVEPDCRWTVAHLAELERDALNAADTDRAQRHLQDCLHCTLIQSELDEVASRLRAVLFPLLTGLTVPGTALGPTSVAPETGATAPSQTPHHAQSTSSPPATLTAGAHGVAGAGKTAIAWAAVVSLSVAAVAAAAAVDTYLARTPAQPTAHRGEHVDAPDRALPDPSPSRSTPQPDPTVEPHDITPDDVPAPTSPDDVAPVSAASPPAPTARATAPPPSPGHGEKTGATARAEEAPAVGPAPEPETGDETLPVLTEPSPPEGPGTPSDLDRPVASPVLPAPATDWPSGMDLLTAPNITGTAHPGALVEVLDHTGRVIAAGDVPADGAWSIRLPTPSAREERYAARQTTGGRTSPLSEPSPRYTYGTPVIITPAEGSTIGFSADHNGNGLQDEIDLRFAGQAGQSVLVLFDGVPTHNVHVLGLTPLLRYKDEVTAGLHTLTLRYVDPATGALGLGTTSTFAVGPRSLRGGLVAHPGTPV